MKTDSGIKQTERIEKDCRKYHADFLTLQDMIILKAEKAGYESVTTDGIHLTEYGNEIIAGAWLQLFEKIKMEIKNHLDKVHQIS